MTEPPIEPTLDPAVPGGITLLVAGLGAFVPGIAVFSKAAEGKEKCFQTSLGESCHKRDDFVGKQVGASLIAAGSTALLVGVPSWAASADPDPFPADNVAMGASGMVFTGLGSALVVCGAVSWIVMTDRHAKWQQMIGGGVMGPVGVATLALGLPLWIEGSEAPHGAGAESGPQLVWTPEQFVRRSPAMMAGGIGLIMTSGAGAIATVVLAAMQGDYRSSSDGMPPAMAAGYTGSAAAVLLGVGIALVAYGSAQVPPNEASAHAHPKGAPAAPRVLVGPGGADVSWTF